MWSNFVSCHYLQPVVVDKIGNYGNMQDYGRYFMLTKLCTEKSTRFLNKNVYKSVDNVDNLCKVPQTRAFRNVYKYFLIMGFLFGVR